MKQLTTLDEVNEWLNGDKERKKHIIFHLSKYMYLPVMKIDVQTPKKQLGMDAKKTYVDITLVVGLGSRKAGPVLVELPQTEETLFMLLEAIATRAQAEWKGDGKPFKPRLKRGKPKGHKAGKKGRYGQ